MVDLDRSRPVLRSAGHVHAAESEGHPLARRRAEPDGDGPRDSPRPGKLKIFFGYSAALGKTRAMLLAVEAHLAAGARVLLAADVRRFQGPGALRPPAGLEVVEVTCGQGLDVDEVLRRGPDLLLLPALAERNPEQARHRRRYQDVHELLEAGIDVWSTLEVRHIESLADLVQRITDSPVDQTVPDAVFDAADEVELVDLAPEDLLERIRKSSRTYPLKAAAGTAIPGRATLVALRELALRRAADRLNRREQTPGPASGPRARQWRTAERLLVCIGPSPTSARVIRTASRMANSMQAPWIAAYAGQMTEEPEPDERRIARHLRLAESLGADTATLPGGNVPLEIVGFARSRGVTKIIIGKTGRAIWRSYLKRSLVDRVIAESGDIDVYVIRGKDEPIEDAATVSPKRWRVRPYAEAVVVLGLSTLVAWTFGVFGLAEGNLILAYLLGVTAVAAWLGRGPAIFASVGAVLLFNFFFTSPHYTLQVHDSGYIFTFAVMLVIGILVSTLTARIRDQSVAARQREQRTEQLYALSQELSATTGTLQIVTTAETRLGRLIDGEIAILLSDDAAHVRPAGPTSPGLARDPKLLAVAEWVREHGRSAGAGTDTHSDAPALCLPLTTPEGVAGVLAVRTRDPDLLVLPDRRRLIETFAAQVALALQRDRLTEKVHRSLAQAENERLRSAVLSSVSHDFRTPLAAITGASSSLLDAGDRIQPEERRGLLQSIYQEGDRLGRLVDNLLHMTRLESGQLEPKREWNIVEDLVGSALTRLSEPLASHAVTIAMPQDLPLIWVDGVLIELVLTNLLDNAARYSPVEAPVEVRARAEANQVLVDVADRGPGLSAEEKTRAFEKFYRGSQQRQDGSRGAGLGLAICAAIAQLHGGGLTVKDREGGGARFVLALPLESQPPAIEGPESNAGGESEQT